MDAVDVAEGDPIPRQGGSAGQAVAVGESNQQCREGLSTAIMLEA